jgi:glycosyltransferase involved in cell wall biosynthesis
LTTSLPAVTVIVPTHNRSKLLRRALVSILGQSYGDFEVIVVDDGSEHSPVDVVNDLDDSRIQLLTHETNRGAAGARNTALKVTKGRYVAFLDDDDEWLPEKLELQVEVMNSSPPKVGLIYCWMDYFDSTGALVSETHPTISGDVFSQVLGKQRLAGCPTLLVRTEIARDVGGFDERLLRGNDGDFIRRICKNYEVDLIPKVLVNVHIGHGPRVTSTTREGWQNDESAIRIKLTKFEQEFRSFPKAFAETMIRLGYVQGKLGAHGASFLTYAKAVLKNPTSLETLLSIVDIARANVSAIIRR